MHLIKRRIQVLDYEIRYWCTRYERTSGVCTLVTVLVVVIVE
jgi:hypothetical protein